MVPSDEPGDERANILIVDDLPEKLLVFQTVLDELGQNLVKVRSGSAALREVLKREFAVILLDVNMPDIDGFETAALIRKHPRSMLTPIIFITSYADDVQTAKGYSLGAVDYILSPVDPDILRSKVSVFVSLYLMSRQIQRQADGRAAVLAAEAAQRVAEENDRRSAFLARASRELSDSLDTEVAVRHCAELLVPEIAAFAVVQLSDADFAHMPDCVAAGDKAAGAQLSWQAESQLDAQIRKVLRRATLSRQRIVERAGDAAATSAGMSPGSALMSVPLIIGERVLGAVLVAASPDDHWSATSWMMLEEIASRAATAFENVRLYGVLQREVRDRMAIQEELQEADRRKDEFLAMMSHELRNPLSSIKLAVEVIRRHAAPHAKVDWGLDVADRQLRQLMRLIEELLDVTRISRGKIVLKRESLKLNAVLAQSVETVDGLMHGRHQILDTRLPQESLWVQGDMARLTQVFANLLHNASKYSGDSSTITLDAAPDADGTMAVVVVTDKGIGIDAELLPRVFDMFAQGQHGLDRAQGGLGVGLTLARRLTELHGGEIEVHSEGRDKGSRFTVRLPLSEPPFQGEAGHTHNAPGERLTKAFPVLVVDDNKDAATALASLFEGEGHRVRVAEDGERAMAEFGRFMPRVVVLDIGLPVVDGYEVARRMRQMPGGRNCLLIALTGYGQYADRARAIEAGFDAHFVKPAEVTQLLGCIQDWAGKPSGSCDP